MAMYTTVFIDGHPLLITPVEDQYGVSTGSNGKKEWSINFYANNTLANENVGTVPYLHGWRTYIDVDGSTHKVDIVNNAGGDLTALAKISVTLTEEGYDDTDEDDSDDIDISGTIAGHAFTGKLSDFSEAFDPHGELTSSITGKMLKSNHFGERVTWTFDLAYWPEYDALRRSNVYSFEFSYTDKEGVAYTKSGSGYLDARSRTGNRVNITLKGEGLI